MPVKYQLFIQDHSGDHNLEMEFESHGQAWGEVEDIRKGGGYWNEDDTVFVPWHRVDFARVTKIEDKDA